MSTESLRDRQKRMAREEILNAAAELIVEVGTESIALADVAERAGVSTRTLYNYFESREALFMGISERFATISRELGGFDMPEGMDTLPDVIRANWRAWGDQGTLTLAAMRLSAAGNISPVAERRRQRHDAFAEVIADFRPDLDEGRAGEIGSMIHAMCGGAVFERMVVQDGIDPGTAAELIAWLVSLVRDGLADGEVPIENPKPEATR